MMFRLALLALLAIFASAPARAADTAAANGVYLGLLGAAKQGEPVDWTKLRYAYAASSAYDADGKKTDGFRTQMFTAMTGNNWAEAARFADEILARNYVDIDGQMGCNIANLQLGNAAKAGPCGVAARGLVKSIMVADGATPTSALTIISKSEEVALLRALNMRPHGEETITQDGHSYLKVNVANSDGNVRLYYFLLDRMLDAQMGNAEAE